MLNSPDRPTPDADQEKKLKSSYLLSEANSSLTGFEDHLNMYYPDESRLKIPFESPTGTKWLSFKRNKDVGKVTNILIEEDILKQEGNESLRVTRRDIAEDPKEQLPFFAVIDYGPGRMPVTTSDTQPIVDNVNAGLQEFYRIKTTNSSDKTEVADIQSDPAR